MLQNYNLRDCIFKENDLMNITTASERLLYSMERMNEEEKELVCNCHPADLSACSDDDDLEFHKPKRK